jgi:hypothetical protein
MFHLWPFSSIPPLPPDRRDRGSCGRLGDLLHPTRLTRSLSLSSIGALWVPSFSSSPNNCAFSEDRASAGPVSVPPRLALLGGAGAARRVAERAEQGEKNSIDRRGDPVALARRHDGAG